jgi:hypothetical protein
VLSAILGLQSFCLAQGAATDPSQSPEAAQPSAIPSKSAATGASITDSSAATPSARQSPVNDSIPTAAQIEDKALQDATQGLNTPDLAPPNPLIATRTLPATPSSNQQVPSKYDVTQIGQRQIGNGVNFYSLDREMALGRQLAHEVEQSSRLVTDPVVTEYVNRIGQNLVRNSDARVPFSIKVLDNEEVNAFALPGGFFYVDSGLILAAENEAELAGVMAHEIAHVAARHATKNLTKAQIWNMAQVPLMIFGGPVAYAISEVAGLAVPLGFLKFSRDAEREADLLGLEYDYAAGYDPNAFVTFFEKLNAQEHAKKHNAIAKAFSTHPMNIDRIKSAQDEIRKYLPDRPQYVVDTSEFESVKARLLTYDNAMHIGGPQDSRRPVLMRRSIPAPDDANGGFADDGSSAPLPHDDHPTLTHRTATPADKDPATVQPQNTGTPSQPSASDPASSTNSPSTDPAPAKTPAEN